MERFGFRAEKPSAFQFKFITDYFQIADAKGPVLAANMRAKWLSLLSPVDLKIAFAIYKGQTPMYGAEYVKIVDKNEPGWWNHYFFNSWQVHQETTATGWSVGPNIDLSKPLKAMVPLVVNSNYQKQLVLARWKDYDPSLITVIPSMVDRNLFTPGRRAQEPIVGWIGYDNPSKYTKGVEVIPYLARQFPKVTFEMVHGAVPQFQEEWMKEHLPNVRILTKVPHQRLPEVIRRWHVLVCGSKWETGATHVKEAMSCGIPVIAASIGTLPEVASTQLLLPDMKYGFPPETSRPYEWTKPSLQKFADALQDLLGDQRLQKKLSRTALRESSFASPIYVSEQWFQFMRKCRDQYSHHKKGGVIS